MYELPARLRLNQWALSGDWTVRKEAAALNKPNGRIAYRFHARDLHLVMGPAAPGTSVRFRVLIDGQPPGAAHGSRRRRAGQRHGDRAAAVPADPAAEAHRRSAIRNRVSRSGRGGFRVHVRLIRREPSKPSDASGRLTMTKASDQHVPNRHATSRAAFSGRSAAGASPLLPPSFGMRSARCGRAIRQDEAEADLPEIKPGTNTSFASAEADRCRRPERRLCRGRPGRWPARHSSARLALRHPQLRRCRAAAGLGRLPRDRSLSARLRHDALSFERHHPQRPAVGARGRHRSP